MRCHVIFGDIQRERRREEEKKGKRKEMGEGGSLHHFLSAAYLPETY